MNKIMDILKGILMGIANVIPGVSGGTIASVLGIYERIIGCLSHFLTCSMKQKIAYIKDLWAIGVGLGIGIIGFAKIIKMLLEDYPRPTAIAFIILILISVPSIVRGYSARKPSNILAFVLGGATIGIFIVLDLKFGKGTSVATTGLPAITTMYLAKLFVCGIIAAVAMILPGISGSLLLLLLGEYYHVLSFINSLKIFPLLIFGAGIIIGLVTIAKIIEYFFARHKEVTIWFITGLVVLSVVQVWMKIS